MAGQNLVRHGAQLIDVAAGAAIAKADIGVAKAGQRKSLALNLDAGIGPADRTGAENGAHGASLARGAVKISLTIKRGTKREGARMRRPPRSPP